MEPVLYLLRARFMSAISISLGLLIVLFGRFFCCTG